MLKKSFLMFILLFSLNNNIKPMGSQEICKADAYDSFDRGHYNNGNPYLMQLLFDGRADVFIMSVETGGDSVEMRNRFGITSLMLAAAKGGLEVVKVISLRASENFIIQTDDFGLNALDHAIINNKQEIVNYLRSLDVNWDN